MFWIGLMVGLFVGAAVGFIVARFCDVSHSADAHLSE